MPTFFIGYQALLGKVDKVVVSIKKLGGSYVRSFTRKGCILSSDITNS